MIFSRTRLARGSFAAVVAAAALVAACGSVQVEDDAAVADPIDAGAISEDGGVIQLLVVEPGDVSFGTLLVGGESAEALLLVRNDGNVATGTLAVQTAGADIAEFEKLGDACNGQVIAAGAVCEISIKLKPTAAGAKVGAVIIGDGVVRAEAALHGTALEPGALSISPATHEFGTLSVGQAATSDFVVTNTGGVITGAISTVLDQPGPMQNHYTITADQCAGQTLGAGVSCTVTVRFAPMSEGNLLNTLSASATPGDTAVASLSGSGAFPPKTLTVNVVNLLSGGSGQSAYGFVVSSPPGIDCHNDCEEIYPYGTMVQLQALQGTKTIFSEWIGACVGSQPTCVVNMTAARQVTAVFDCLPGTSGCFQF